jgi:hypothetical protein
MRRWATLDPAKRRELGEQAFAWGDGSYGLAASVDALEAVLRRAAGGS